MKIRIEFDGKFADAETLDDRTMSAVMELNGLSKAEAIALDLVPFIEAMLQMDEAERPVTAVSAH